jgi:hypothetical protein
MDAAATFASFSSAITSVLSSDWLDRKAWIDARSVRPLEAYWQTFSPRSPISASWLRDGVEQ